MTFMSEPEIAIQHLKEKADRLERGKLLAAYPEYRKLIERGEYPSETAQQILEELVPEWVAHFLAGNRGYGDQADELGPCAQFVDIHRKVGKLKRALWEEKDIGKEGVEEVALDLIGHCFLLLRTIRPRYAEVERVAPEAEE